MTRKKKARRSPGTGSIRVRPDTGRIQAAFTTGYDERGNPQRVRRDFDTTEEAELWLAEQLVAQARGELLVQTDQTLSDRVEAWLGALEPKLAESSMHDYRSTVERYVLPHLGRVRLKDLKPHHVDSMMTALHKGGKSAFIIEKAHRYLSMVLISSVELELIPRNVARNVRPPKPSKRQHPRWSAGEALKVLEHCAGVDHPVARYVILGLVTGLRKEELLGLRWSDVDIAAGRLSVVQTATFVQGSAVLRPVPKSDAARRTLYFDERGIAALTVQLEHVELAAGSATRWVGHDLVFPSSIGTPMPERFLREGFKGVWEAAKAPKIRLYDLRSTHGSILADAGVNPKLIAERLGHADPGFTMRVYVRTQEPEQRAVAAAFAGALSGSRVAISPATGATCSPGGAEDERTRGEDGASGAALSPDVN